MSNALVDNIGNASGSLVTPTQYVVRGSAKAWANLNGTGTIALRDSLNVSSVVDNGTGDYTFNWSNNFANADFSSQTGGGGGVSSILTPGTRVATNYNMRTFGASSTPTDATFVEFGAQGDLA